MRKNAQEPEVEYRSAMRCCTLWIRSIFFMRVNCEASPSVCTSRIRLLRLALVTRATAPSAAAMVSDSHTSSAAMRIRITVNAMADGSVIDMMFL